MTDQKGTIRKVQAGVAIVFVVATIIGLALIWNSPPSPELDATMTAATIELNDAGQNLLNVCHDGSGQFIRTESACIEGALSMEASCKTIDHRYARYLTICEDPRFKSAIQALKGAGLQ